jgi:anti-sigma B factor antagonist
MEIKFERDFNSNLIVRASGKLDIDTAAEYGMKIKDELDEMENPNALILDFAEISYIASIGLRVLLELYQYMDKQGATIKVLHVQSPVADVLKMTGFDKFLKVS